MQLRRGLARRQTITTSRDRIRTVDVTANPLHRVLGLARVVIGTGTNDHKGEGRLVLDGLTLAVAAALRDDLLHRSAEPPTARSAGETVPDDETHELAVLDRRWVRYAPFTLSGVLTGLVIWGFYWRVQGESGVNLLRSGPLRSVSDALRRLPTPVEVLVVAGALVVFVAVTSTIGYVLAFWNFRLVRHDGGTLQVTRGLLTIRATSIERRRLVGVALTEPLPLRWVRATRTTAIATGLRTGRGAERGGEVLLPPAPRDIAVSVAARALDGSIRGHDRPSPAWPAGPPPKVEPSGCRRGGADGGDACSVGRPARRPGRSGSGSRCWRRRRRWRSTGTATSGTPSPTSYLVAGSGSLLRRRIVLDRRAVIGWNLRSSFFQRRAGLVTLTATTAAGRQSYEVSDVDGAEALVIADAVTPELLAAFRTGPTPTSR